MGSILAAGAPGTHEGTRLAGRYHLGERLADGALATVYRGQDLVLRRPIAVKVVRQEAAAAYRAALRDTSTLSHPAAVCLYDAIESEGALFIIQEHVVGHPLGLYLREGVPVERAVDLAAQIARALVHAHLHGVVHGDLTPAAVLVDRNAVARINNFGLPPDLAYFDAVRQAVAASFPGQAGPEREDDRDGPLASAAGDTRALGYLFWQLLSEPDPAADRDGGDESAARGRSFRAGAPTALRDLVARTVGEAVRDPILDPQTLALELDALAQEMARARPAVSVATPPAVLAARAVAAREAPWSTEDTVGGRPGWSGGALAGDPTVPDGARVLPDGAEASGVALRSPAAARARPPSRPFGDGGDSGAAPRWSFPGADALDEQARGRPGFPLIAVLLLGGVLFVLFFLVGFYSAIWR